MGEVGCCELLSRAPLGGAVWARMRGGGQRSLLSPARACVSNRETSGPVRAQDSDFGRRVADPREGAADRRVSPTELAVFKQAVRQHYGLHGRDLPWRSSRDPYHILLSEMMLQQTQVARVLPKYEMFLRAFPSLVSLAAAPFAEVLAVWSGLGYNRRALSLHRAAGEIVSHHAGAVPDSVDALQRLPGIGPNTAAAVCVFAFQQALVFIETNIRSAFLHHFFQGCPQVPDREILPLVTLTLDSVDPRTWYYALMDYGVWVKRTYGNPSRRSAHHTRQSTFTGSNRELRSGALRALLAVAPSPLTAEEVCAAVASMGRERHQIEAVLRELAAEGFVKNEGSDAGYRIA